MYREGGGGGDTNRDRSYTDVVAHSGLFCGRLKEKNKRGNNDNNELRNRERVEAMGVHRVCGVRTPLWVGGTSRKEIWNIYSTFFYFVLFLEYVYSNNKMAMARGRDYKVTKQIIGSDCSLDVW